MNNSPLIKDEEGNCVVDVLFTPNEIYRRRIGQQKCVSEANKRGEKGNRLSSSLNQNEVNNRYK